MLNRRTSLLALAAAAMAGVHSQATAIMFGRASGVIPMPGAARLRRTVAYDSGMSDLKPHEKPLTHADIKALRQCIDHARAWRGAFVGDPDTSALDQLDAQVKRARLALRKVRELKKQGL